MGKSEEGAYWAVVLGGDDSDIRMIVSGGLGAEGVEVRQTDDGWLMTADTFEAAGQARGVRRAAEATLDVVNGVGALLDRAFRPLKAGHVYRLHADGRKDAFVQLEGAIEARARVNAVLVSTTSDGSPAPAPKSQLDKALAAAQVDDNLARDETREAVELGCYFSFNPRDAKRGSILDIVPVDRVLTETDHPYGDLGQAVSAPGATAAVEARLNPTNPGAARLQVWSNFRRLAEEAGVMDRLPSKIAGLALAAPRS